MSITAPAWPGQAVPGADRQQPGRAWPATTPWSFRLLRPLGRLRRWPLGSVSLAWAPFASVTAASSAC